MRTATMATLTLLLTCTAAFAQQKGTFTDARDKKKYQTVRIGNYTWMAENLSYNAKSSSCPGEDEESGDGNTSIRCYKNNAFTQCANVECLEWREDGDFQQYCDKYRSLTAKEIQNNKKEAQDKKKAAQAECAKKGRVYHWEASKTYCPAGWRLPTKDEWNDILKAVGGSNNTAGKMLKAKSGWDGNGNGTDEYGFTALPGASNWLTATDDKKYKWCYEITSDSEYAKMSGNCPLAFVRCLKEPTAAELKSLGVDSRDKKQYKVIQIGGQIWMGENLNYSAEGSKCYDGKPENCKKHGQLYSWLTAMSLPPICDGNSTCSNQIRSKHQGICPDGWHIPSNTEWNELANFIGGKSVAGTKLKAKSGWNKGTDDFGFSALPSGYGKADGGFESVGNGGLWWAANDFSNYATLSNTREDLYSGNVAKDLFLSVRCIYGEASKETLPTPTAAPAKAPAPAAAPAKQAAPAGNSSKPMYCVSSVMNNPVACIELTDTPANKSICDKQNVSAKMMMGKAEWTANKPSIPCDKVPNK